MCGIAGLYNWSDQPQAMAARVSAMCGAIVHRGPDDEGIFVDRGVALGMRRLSIIDVAGGHQPIFNEDRSVAVVFNGEIYNYRSLRTSLTQRGHRFSTNSDTEVIVHSYEEDGPDCVKHFNGIFGFAIWDKRAQRLVIARDRMGVKPLYYMQTKQGWAFGSEIKSLLTLPDAPRTLDLEAAAQFFRLGFVPAPRTLFRGIQKLPAGWRLVAERGKVQVQRYWDLEFEQHDSFLSFNECAEQLRSVLQEAVTDQMVSDVPVGAFLSGGVDSTGVVAFMRKATNHPVRTFSIGFDQQHAYHNEAPYAEAAARALGTRHETLIVRPQIADLIPALVEKLDEPLSDTSFLLSHLVSELAHRHVKVALSGVGGDELFGGYRRYFAPLMNKSVAWIPLGLRRVFGTRLHEWLPADRGSVLGNLCRYGKALGRTCALPIGEQYLGLLSVLSKDLVHSLFRTKPGGSDPGEELITLYDRAPASSPLDRLAYVDMKTALPESLLLLTDKMGMANSLEIRVPFLDNRVVDLMRHIPSQYRLRGFQLKRLLKASLKGVVPDFVLTRSKRGFGMPIGTWLRSDLRPLVSQLLDKDRLARDGIFDPSVVGHLIAAHDASAEDYTEAIVALLVFEVWRERFGVRLS